MSSHVIPIFRKARQHRMRIAWSVWCVSMVFVLFQFFLQLSSGEVIKSLMHSFALTAFGGGILASSYYYIYVLLQTPAGMLMDRYGPRGILSMGSLTVGMGCIVFFAAKTVSLALLGRILMGGGAAFAFVGCLNVISIWFPKRQFAFMAAVVETAGMAGAIFGNFWLAQFIEKTGWRHAMLMGGVFGCVLSVFLWTIVRNSPRRKGHLPAISKASVKLLDSVKPLLRNKLIWLNGAYSGVMFSVVTVFIALWAIPFFELSHHIDLVRATIVASSLYVGVGIGGPILGWLDARTCWRKRIMILNAFCATVFLTLSIYCVHFSLIALSTLLLLTGICASSYVLTFAIANDFASPTNRATCIGFTNMLCVAFAPILQPLVGLLLTHFDRGAVPLQSVLHFQWAVSIVPLALLLATVIACFLPDKT